jgi:ribosomal protein L25 (general stress protein Ctc)
LEDPGKFVSGLTKEQVEANPSLAEFLKTNFTEEGESKLTIPIELLREYGLDTDALTQSSSSSQKGAKPYGEPRIDAGLGTSEQQALNIRKLFTYKRHEEGTRACDSLRDHFYIPGILYGSDPTQGILSSDKSTRWLLKTPWTELQRELDRYHRKFESRVYDLTVLEDESDSVGTVHRVLPRDVQRHPVLDTIYCANFLRYHAGRPIKIPLVYINKEESNALKRDGYIIPVNKHVECLIEDGVPIPEALEVECTGLEMKQVIRLDRVIFPDGVTPSRRVNKETFIVGPVAGGRGGSAATEEEPAAGAK